MRSVKEIIVRITMFVLGKSSVEVEVDKEKICWLVSDSDMKEYHLDNSPRAAGIQICGESLMPTPFVWTHDDVVFAPDDDISN